MKKLLKYSEHLKHLPRSGWGRHNISAPESVAAHSWQMALAALWLSGTIIEEDYDFNKVIKLCLCHDLAESIIGDITPDSPKYASKHEKEEAAMLEIAEKGDFPEAYRLFKEYEEAKTPEALLARDLDKLDMYAQSLAYEERYGKKDLSEFRRSAARQIQTPLGKILLKDIEQKAETSKSSE